MDDITHDILRALTQVEMEEEKKIEEILALRERRHKLVTELIIHTEGGEDV